MILKNFIVKLLFILIVILCLVYSATSFAIESSYIWSDSSNFEQSLKTNAPINGQNSNLNSESNSNPNRTETLPFPCAVQRNGSVSCVL